MNVQKITPYLWFDKEAYDAATFYKTVFKNAEITSTNPMITTMHIEGLNLIFLNGGPIFKLSEAFSLLISCDTQEEIDYYWDALIAGGGNESRCGWLKDKFGVSWQVVPSILPKLMSDPAKAGEVMQAFLKMNKFIIADLEKAAG